MTKPTKWHVRPAKTQINLGIRPVWSESSLSAWRKRWSLATHWVHSKDSAQTGRMPRLIWVFAGRTCLSLFLTWGGLYVFLGFLHCLGWIRTRRHSFDLCLSDVSFRRWLWSVWRNDASWCQIVSTVFRAKDGTMENAIAGRVSRTQPSVEPFRWNWSRGVCHDCYSFCQEWI